MRNRTNRLIYVVFMMSEYRANILSIGNVVDVTPRADQHYCYYIENRCKFQRNDAVVEL